MHPAPPPHPSYQYQPRFVFNYILLSVAQNSKTDIRLLRILILCTSVARSIQWHRIVSQTSITKLHNPPVRKVIATIILSTYTVPCIFKKLYKQALKYPAWQSRIISQTTERERKVYLEDNVLAQGLASKQIPAEVDSQFVFLSLFFFFACVIVEQWYIGVVEHWRPWAEEH